MPCVDGRCPAADVLGGWTRLMYLAVYTQNHMAWTGSDKQAGRHKPHTHPHARTHARTHAHKPMYTHTLTDTLTHSHTHTRTHKHMHTGEEPQLELTLNQARLPFL